MSKELTRRLKYFAQVLSEHEEHKDSYTMGHFEYEMARNKQNTIREIGEHLLEILELDNVTFQSWLTQEEDK